MEEEYARQLQATVRTLDTKETALGAQMKAVANDAENASNASRLAVARTKTHMLQ